jgi:uncharacterized membrane protein YphA (DoxX/SURF4 family)
MAPASVAALTRTLGKHSGFGASLEAVPRPSPRVLDAVGTVARLGLAVVWIASGAIKLFDPHGTVASVKAYELVPDGLVSLVAAVLPFLELALGLLLLLGVGVRIVAVLSGIVLLVYIAGIAQSWARGLTIDCGCFGGGGQVAAGQTHYPQEILRDTGFLLLAVWLTVRPRTFVSLDGWLTGPTQEPATLEKAS